MKRRKKGTADALLQGEFFSFSVDEITPDGQFSSFVIRLIPDIASKYFPPFHLRYLKAVPEMLSDKMYSSLLKHQDRLGEERFVTENFRNEIRQGAYYKVPVQTIAKFMGKESQSDNTIQLLENQSLSRYIMDPPFETPELGFLSGESTVSKLSNLPSVRKMTNAKIVCFKVGQGDSSLVITDNGHTFLIDTNIYYDGSKKTFIDNLQTVLHDNQLPTDKITGLIITHKHLDHLRGADQLLADGRIKFSYFIINDDYNHNTAAVSRLYKQASTKIDNHINLNDSQRVQIGSTVLCFRNPNSTTRNEAGAPDINDSSIAICMRGSNELGFLTGDAGFVILNDCCQCKELTNANNFLKVAHHGSTTGTDAAFLNLINPTRAFVSAGTSKKYGHPHEMVIKLLKDKGCDYTVSKAMSGENCITYDIN